MNILSLIKDRRTIRKYQNKLIPKRIINKIVKSGQWGSSLHGIQPWRFIVVRKKTVIIKFSDILLQRREEIGMLSRVLLHSSANTIKNSRALILIYNSGTFTSWVMKYGDSLDRRNINVAKIAEVSAISATIQNMILAANFLGLSSCWHDSILLCKKDIKKIFDVNDDLVAVLTLGYSAEKGKRSNRKSILESIKFIE